MISYEKFSHNLNLEFKIVRKISTFQCYWWKHSNAEKQFIRQKFQLKRKKFKTSFKAQIAPNRSKEIIQLLPDKSWRKVFFLKYTGIYKHLLSKYFKNTVLGRLEMVEFANVFSDTNQKHACWKICKACKVFGCVAGVKLVRFFGQNSIVKWVIFFASFSWL